MGQTKAEHIIAAMLNRARPSSCWIDGSFSFVELEQAQAFQQRVGTVFSHTMDVLDCLRVSNPITLLSALFHDLGKLKTKVVSPDDTISFPKHDSASSIIALDTMQEWETDPYIMDRVIRIAKTHMTDICNPFSDQAIRNFIAKVGYDNMDNWFVVRYADAIAYLGQKKDVYITNVIETFEKQVHTIMDKMPKEEGPVLKPSIEGMQISGDDLDAR